MIANGTSYTDTSGIWIYNGALQRWEIDGTPIFITGSANNAVTANGSLISVGNTSVNATMSSTTFALNGVPLGFGMTYSGKIVESHTGNAATFALKTFAGNDPSPTTPIGIIFPDGSQISQTTALSITIPSTATMGVAVTSAAFRIWIGIANNS